MKKSISFLLICSFVFITFKQTHAADCDFKDKPKAPVNYSEPPTPGVVLFKSGCKTDMGTYSDPRCVTFSPKGNSAMFWKFWKEVGTKDPNDNTTKEPTENREFQFAAKGDLSFLSEGGGNFIYESKTDSGFYYAVEKYSDTDVGKLDAIRTTGYFRIGKTTLWDSFMAYNQAWDVYYSSSSCNPHLPTLESGVNSDSSRYIWRIVLVGKLQFNGKDLNERANIQLRLASKAGPPLDTVPTDSEGNFEFSRKYQAGEGVGNEEIWLNSNVEKKITLSFQYTDEDGGKYQDFKDLDIDNDFRDHKDLKDTKVVKSSIDFNLTDKNKVDSFDRDQNAVANSVVDNLFGEPGEEYCPSSSWYAPTTWFSSSLCGLGIALHDAGIKLMDFAQKQLFAVLGYTNTNNKLKSMGY